MEIWLGVLGIAFALAMDAFAVSIATGIKLAPPQSWQILRMAACFGVFQCVMPIIGWFAGSELAVVVADWDHWVAFLLLAAVGGKMIADAFVGDGENGDDNRSQKGVAAENKEKCAGKPADPTRCPMLLMLGVATSIDAFAVGVSMAMLDRSIWIPCMTFGLVAAAMSAMGMRYGGRLGRRVGRRAEVAGGLVLILIGLTTLISHLIK